MTYRVSLSRAAEKYLRRRVPPVHARRIREAIDGLTEDPWPQRRSRKLSGAEDEWRLRVGDYRAIYAVDDEEREVLVLEVFHRQRGYG